MILFAAYVGLRAGELYALDRSQIDLAAGEVRIERSYGSKTREMTLPKNGRSRTVILPPPAREALRSTPRRPDQEHVFAGKRGQRLSATTHFHLWNPVRAAAGTPELDWHHLRHVAGSLMADRGLSAQDIAYQLGHTDGGRLAQRLYIHTYEDSAKERIRRAFGENVAPLRPLGDAIETQAAEGGA